MENCIGVFGKVFGHNFKKVFDESIGEPSLGEIHVPACDMVKILEASKARMKTYLFSECQRCGQRIPRKV